MPTAVDPDLELKEFTKNRGIAGGELFHNGVTMIGCSGSSDLILVPSTSVLVHSPTVLALSMA